MDRTVSVSKVKIVNLISSVIGSMYFSLFLALRG
jgi:hypothetical protein